MSAIGARAMIGRGSDFQESMGRSILNIDYISMVMNEILKQDLIRSAKWGVVPMFAFFGSAVFFSLISFSDSSESSRIANFYSNLVAPGLYLMNLVNLGLVFNPVLGFIGCLRLL